MEFQRVFNDGGKQAFGFTHEKNDCCVRAVSIATGITYPEAHQLLKEKTGRKDGKCTFGFHIFVEKYIKYFDKAYRYSMPNEKRAEGSIKRFLREYKEGTYIVSIKGHAFAVVNGVINDKYTPRLGSHVIAWWRVA